MNRPPIATARAPDPTQPSSLSRRLVRFVAVPNLLYFAGFVVLTWPWLPAFSSSGFGHGDVMANIWIMWWFHHAIVESHVNPFWTTMLFHPDGTSLVPHTIGLINSLLFAVPFGSWLTPVQVHNLAMIGGFVLAGWLAFVLAWRLSRSYAGSLFAGALFTFSHFHLTHATAHLNLVATMVLPLFVLAWLWFLERPNAARGAAAAGAFGLVLTVDFYYLTFCALTGLLLVGLWIVRSRGAWLRTPALWRGFASFLALSALLCGPWVGRLIYEMRTDPYAGAHDATELAMDLLSPFVPGTQWWGHRYTEGVWSRIRAGDPEQSVYFGLSLLVPAIVGFVRQRRSLAAQGLLAIAVLFFLAALGPRITVLNHTVLDHPTPYDLLERVLPVLQMGGSTVRMIVMTVLALSILAAFGFATFGRRGRWILVALLLVEVWPRTLPLTPVAPAEFAVQLQQLPPGAIHGPNEDLFPYERDHLNQTFHERPMLLGYTARWPMSRFQRFIDIEQIEREERWGELFRRYGVRYVVLRELPQWEWRRPGLKAIWKGGGKVIYVAPDDPLPAAPWATDAGPGFTTLAPGSVEIRAPQSHGCRYVMVFSGGTEPGVLLPGGQRLPVAPDVLFLASLRQPSTWFEGNVGALDHRGVARVSVRLPEDWAERLGKVRWGFVVFKRDGYTVDLVRGGELLLK